MSHESHMQHQQVFLPGAKLASCVKAANSMLLDTVLFSPPPPHPTLALPLFLASLPVHASTTVAAKNSDMIDWLAYHCKVGAIWGNDLSHSTGVEPIETEPACIQANETDAEQSFSCSHL